MKSNMFLLLKTSLSNSYKIKSKFNKKSILWGLLIIYICFSLCFSAFNLLTLLYEMLEKFYLTNYYMTLLVVSMSICSFFFTIFAAKSWLFDNKDNDLLLALPVKRSDILGSRLLQVMLYNFIIGLVILIPGLVVALNHMTVNVPFIINTVIVIFGFSIIPTILACLFGYLIASISSKAKNKNVVELISYVVFIALYFIVFSSTKKLLTNLMSNPELFKHILMYGFYPVYLVGRAYVSGNVLYSLLFLIISLFILYAFLAILNIKYFKIISESHSYHSKSNYKMTSLTSNNVKTALVKKEFNRYFGSAIYVFNTCFGALFLIVASVASFFFGFDEIVKTMDVEVELNPFTLVFGLIMFSISLTNISASSISIERDSFWILKMLPVNEKTIFSAKRIVNETMLIPFCIIAILLFRINGYLGNIEMLLMILLSIVYTIFISTYGLIINLKMPKMDATNDTVIVKQSAASFLTIMSGIVFFGISIGILFGSSLSNISNLIILNVLITILLIVSLLVLNSWGVKRFKELS